MHKIPANKLLGRNPPVRRKILLEYMKSPSGVADRVLAEKLKIDQSDLVKQHLKALKSLHLFSWDNVPGGDSEGLLKHLEADYGIKWAENAEIHKSDDNKTVHISKDGDSAEIAIEDEGSATLKIDNRAYDLQVKEENGELNLYKHGLIEKCSVAVTRPMGRVGTPTKIDMTGHCWSSDINTIHVPVLSNIFDPDDEEAWGALTNLRIYHGWIPELIEQYDYLLPPFVSVNIPSQYLFSWEHVPGKDNERLIRYLDRNFRIRQVERAEIRKSDDGKTIDIRNKGKSVKIMIEEKKGKATIKINNEKISDLNVKRENGELNLYTNPIESTYPAHYEVVGRIEIQDNVVSLMKKYHLPKKYKECIREILKDLPPKERIKTIRSHRDFTANVLGFGDDPESEDISFILMKPHLSKQEKKHFDESLKTNHLASKFVSYFLTANCKERREIIEHIEFGAFNFFTSPSAARRMERFDTLREVASLTDIIPTADYDRMYDESLDAIVRKPPIDWVEIFDQLMHFSFFQCRFA